MNQSNINRTLIFLGVAAMLTLVTWLTSPGPVEQSTKDMVGKQLYPDFKDPLDAVSLQVVTYDEELAEISDFKVAKVDGSWVIPSHEKYPADAEDQLADVASALMDLVVLQTPVEVDENTLDIQAMHKTYGVLDPTDESVAGADEVGIRVVMENAEGETLLDLIIGEEVPDTRDQRYVRRAGEDNVYSVALRADKISAKFASWIEDDLLKLNAWDINRLFVDDYSIDILQGVLKPRGRMKIQFDDAGDPKWSMLQDEAMSPETGQYVERALAEDEELNATTLNDLKQAVDDLKIVDVVRKPEGLIENLRATGYYNMVMTQLQPLAQQGFHFVSAGQNSDGQAFCEIRSTEGDVHVTMKTGVNYVLRFGKTTSLGGTDDSEEEPAEGEEAEEIPAGMNRYLFVMAEVDRSVIPLPDFEALPELPAVTDAPAATETPGEEAPAEEAPVEEAPVEEAPVEGAIPGPDGETSAPAEAEAVVEPAAETEAEAEEPAAEVDPAVIQAEIDRITKDNQRKQEEYDQKVVDAEEEVAKLNARFADWYYIISNETYQKIHLSRDDIVQVKGPEEEAGGMPPGMMGGMPPGMQGMPPGMMGGMPPGMMGGMPPGMSGHAADEAPPAESPFVETTEEDGPGDSGGESMEDFEALKDNPPGDE